MNVVDKFETRNNKDLDLGPITVVIKSLVVSGTRAKTKLWYERVMGNGITVIINKQQTKIMVEGVDDVK